MPPNAKGGKGYKKGKHSKEEEKFPEWDPKEGQMLGRVLRKLGDRRFRIFCNDSKERICKCVGSMRKSEWVEEGGVVIVAIREISNAMSSNSQSSHELIGDVLQVVSKGFYGKLKKTEGINPLLFTNIEQQDMKDVYEKVKMFEAGLKIEDDVFDYSESEDEEEDEGDSDDSDKNLTSAEKKDKERRKREEKAKKRDQKIADARNKKNSAEVDDKFIDAI
jgi:initiation factor 1A